MMDKVTILIIIGLSMANAFAYLTGKPIEPALNDSAIMLGLVAIMINGRPK